MTPFVGERYKDKIEELSEKTGWDIKVSQSINQVEMINILKEILSKYNVEIQKIPVFILQQER